MTTTHAATTDLAAALAAARARAGLSLAGLADRINAAGGVAITRFSLHCYEAGTKVPPAPRLAQVAAATGCTIAARPDGFWTCTPRGAARAAKRGA